MFAEAKFIFSPTVFNKFAQQNFPMQEFIVINCWMHVHTRFYRHDQNEQNQMGEKVPKFGAQPKRGKLSKENEKLSIHFKGGENSRCTSSTPPSTTH